MIDCLIIGDSIAVGVSSARPECVSYAHVGWNSLQFNSKYLKIVSETNSNTTIISLGANDHPGIKTLEELRKLRLSIKSSRVFWIDPGQQRRPVAHQAMMTIAKEYGDTVLLRPIHHTSNDKVHPTYKGYTILGNQTR